MARSADLEWVYPWKGVFHAIESHTQYINLGGVTRKVLIAAGGQGGHSSLGAEQLDCASRVLLGFYSYPSLPFIIIIYFISVIKLFLFLTHEIYLFFFQFSPPPLQSREGKGVSSCVATQLPEQLNYTTMIPSTDDTSTTAFYTVYDTKVSNRKFKVTDDVTGNRKEK